MEITEGVSLNRQVLQGPLSYLPLWREVVRLISTGSRACSVSRSLQILADTSEVDDEMACCCGQHGNLAHVCVNSLGPWNENRAGASTLGAIKA